jgi:hypothetical protein
MAYNNPNPPRDYTRPVDGGATRRTQPALPVGGGGSNNPSNPVGGAVNPFAAKRMQSRYDGDASAYVNDALLPYWERARNEMRSSLADQGMLSSSAGMNRYSQNVEQPYAQAANTMYRDYINQRRSEDFTRRITADQEARAAQQQDWSQDFAGVQEKRAAQQQQWSQGFQTNQANAQNTMNLYNLLWSSYLQGYGLGGDELANLIGRPNQFPMWADIYKLGYQQPASSFSSQNVGDPVSDQKQTDYVPMIRDTPPSLQQKQMEADNAYRSAYLNYLKSTGGGGGGGAAGDVAVTDDTEFRSALAATSDELAARVESGEITKEDAWREFVRLAAVYGKNYPMNEHGATMLVSQYGNLINKMFTTPGAPEPKAPGVDWLTRRSLPNSVNWTSGGGSNQSYAAMLAAQGLGPDANR